MSPNHISDGLALAHVSSFSFSVIVLQEIKKAPDLRRETGDQGSERSSNEGQEENNQPQHPDTQRDVRHHHQELPDRVVLGKLPHPQEQERGRDQVHHRSQPDQGKETPSGERAGDRSTGGNGDKIANLDSQAVNNRNSLFHLSLLPGMFSR